jgi:Transposase DDE domain
MHQTRKGQQWYFGAKAHIGVDSKEVVVHSVITTAASVADKHMLPDLLHGGEKKVWGDAGYQGQTEAIHEAAPAGHDKPPDQVQELCGRASQAQEHDQGQRQVQGRASVPQLEARLRIYEGALSGPEEEP